MVPAVLMPDQAAFPYSARLLPVMLPTPARASRPAGLLNSSSSAPGGARRAGSPRRPDEADRHDLVFIGPGRLGYAWGPGRRDAGRTRHAVITWQGGAMTQRQEPCAVLGMGGMGPGMAASALRAGIPTIVWNRTMEATRDLAELGAEVAETAA